MSFWQNIKERYKRDWKTVATAMDRDSNFLLITSMMLCSGLLLPVFFESYINDPCDLLALAGAYNGMLFISYHDEKDSEETSALLRLYIPFTMLALLAIAAYVAL